MALAQGRDPEGASRARIALGADAEPAHVDEPDCDRARPVGAERFLGDVLAHRLTQVGQLLGEADEVVELRALLLRPEFRVVQVLAPAGAIDPVAWSFAFGCGEIQTSRHAGGMTSASMRSTFSGSMILFPRALT